MKPFVLCIHASRKLKITVLHGNARRFEVQDTRLFIKGQVGVKFKVFVLQIRCIAIADHVQFELAVYVGGNDIVTCLKSTICPVDECFNIQSCGFF